MSAPGRTYGHLRYIPPNPNPRGTQVGRWRISGEPDMLTMLKRMFARVNQDRAGAVIISDTPEVARNIEWVLVRYPLNLDDDAAHRLKLQADTHRATEETVLRILAGRPSSIEIRDTAIPLRDYQLKARDLAVATGRLLDTSDLGLGKTGAGIGVMLAEGALPALVVCPAGKLPKQWQDEIAKFAPHLTTHIARKGTAYDPTELRGVDAHPDVLIMNYHKLGGWADYLAGKLGAVIWDEAHELRHDGTDKYRAAERIADSVRYQYGATNTPVFNYGGETWNIYNVLAPGVLGTKEEFVREWGREDGTKIIVNDPAALGRYLREQGIMYGVTRKEVGRDLPDPIIIRHTVPADLDRIREVEGDVAEMAQLVLDSSARSFDRMQAAGEMDWRLRQATGVAKAPFVAEWIRLLLQTEQRIAVGVWHREVYDILKTKLADFHPMMYSGSESTARKIANYEQFESGDSRILFLSLRSGAGLDGLQDACHTVVFAELDWSPAVHRQFIGRFNRDRTGWLPGDPFLPPVSVYYLLTEHGTDPVIAETLQVKRAQSEPIINPEGQVFATNTGTIDRVKALARHLLAKQRGGATQGDPGAPATPPPPAAVEAVEQVSMFEEVAS